MRPAVGFREAQMVPWSFEEPAKAWPKVPSTAPDGGRFQSPEALDLALHSRLPLYNFRFCASAGCISSKQVCAFEPSDPAGVRSRCGHRWDIDPPRPREEPGGGLLARARLARAPPAEGPAPSL